MTEETESSIRHRKSKSLAAPLLGSALDFVNQFNAYNQICIDAADKMTKFCSSFYQLAEAKYLIFKGPLPGSTKTARLRKKRTNLVIKWYLKG